AWRGFATLAPSPDRAERAQPDYWGEIVFSVPPKTDSEGLGTLTRRPPPMASQKSTLHGRRGPRWPSPDAGNAAAGTRAATTASRASAATADDSSAPDPRAALAAWRASLTPAQWRAGLADAVDAHFLAEHARLFGWRRQLPKGSLITSVIKSDRGY